MIGQEKLTLQEVNILMSWRSNAMRDFSVGFGGGTIFTWLGMCFDAFRLL